MTMADRANLIFRPGRESCTLSWEGVASAPLSDITECRDNIGWAGTKINFVSQIGVPELHDKVIGTI